MLLPGGGHWGGWARWGQHKCIDSIWPNIWFFTKFILVLVQSIPYFKSLYLGQNIGKFENRVPVGKPDFVCTLLTTNTHSNVVPIESLLYLHCTLSCELGCVFSEDLLPLSVGECSLSRTKRRYHSFCLYICTATFGLWLDTFASLRRGFLVHLGALLLMLRNVENGI